MNVYIDDSYVCNTVAGTLDGGGLLANTNVDNCIHFDLWTWIAELLKTCSFSVKFSWHPSHLAQIDVDDGLGDPRCV